MKGDRKKRMGVSWKKLELGAEKVKMNGLVEGVENLRYLGGIEEKQMWEGLKTVLLQKKRNKKK